MPFFNQYKIFKRKTLASIIPRPAQYIEILGIIEQKDADVKVTVQEKEGLEERENPLSERSSRGRPGFGPGDSFIQQKEGQGQQGQDTPEDYGRAGADASQGIAEGRRRE